MGKKERGNEGRETERERERYAEIEADDVTLIEIDCYDHRQLKTWKTQKYPEIPVLRWWIKWTGLLDPFAIRMSLQKMQKHSRFSYNENSIDDNKHNFIINHYVCLSFFPFLPPSGQWIQSIEAGSSTSLFSIFKSRFRPLHLSAFECICFMGHGT